MSADERKVPTLRPFLIPGTGQWGSCCSWCGAHVLHASDHIEWHKQLEFILRKVQP